MKKFLIALAFLPLAAGVASAAEALTDQQMDQVTAGKAFAGAVAFATGHNVFTATVTFAENIGEISAAVAYAIAISY